MLFEAKDGITPEGEPCSVKAFDRRESSSIDSADADRCRLLSFGRSVGGGLQQVPGASTEIAEIHPAGIDRSGQPFRQIKGLVDDKRLRGPFLTHVRQDGALGAGRNDGIGDAFDPDPGTPALAPVVTTNRFEGEDLVGARVFPEAEEHHAWVGGHRSSIAALRSACGVGAAATGERSPTGF